MASVLEQFVTTVRTLSSHGNLDVLVKCQCYLEVIFSGNYKVLCDYLTKSSEILVKNTQHLDNVLETLDLQQHSLGYLVVLCAKFSVALPATCADNRFLQVQEFIHGCNGEQIRLAPDTCNIFQI